MYLGTIWGLLYFYSCIPILCYFILQPHYILEANILLSTSHLCDNFICRYCADPDCGYFIIIWCQRQSSTSLTTLIPITAVMTSDFHYTLQ